jgi:octanoyl-[GcvH]:protein N-octanoyltransferase
VTEVVVHTGLVPTPTDSPDRFLVAGHPDGGTDDPVARLLTPAVLLRDGRASWREIVHVQRAVRPTVAFSSRDLRSPGIVAATAVARDAGFAAVVRSPGGRMVAYDAGAVLVDHLTRSEELALAGSTTFADNAASHVEVIRALGDIDARVGEVEQEYCPGEFSINVGGVAKVLGSAQRITGRAALFSTVLQVEMSPLVREVLRTVSAALGYPLRESSIAGLSDFLPGLTPDRVADALRADYVSRLALGSGPLPASLVAHAAEAHDEIADLPFRVDDWARAHPWSA